MLDAVKDLMSDLASILTETGSGLAQNAALVGADAELSDETGVTVFWNLSMGPMMDKVGELISDIGEILTSLVNAL